MTAILYKGFEVESNSYRSAETGRWALNIHVSKAFPGQSISRNFSAEDTFMQRADAVTCCIELGMRIIDGEVPGASIADLR